VIDLAAGDTSVGSTPYSGRGIMIYWHVERNSLCIHSQLKSPSSSEVASMIEGVIHHCTEMEVDRQYVDSHGQSTIAFAFCKLLGFLLLPRLKAIHSQKLYRPETGKADAYANLQLILSKPIDWDLVCQQYDQMIKYTTALRLGTAETEAILRRFTKKNLQHPTYKAFAELGKAIKTIFLCRYLPGLCRPRSPGTYEDVLFAIPFETRVMKGNRGTQANFWAFPFWRHQRGSRNSRPPDPLAFWRRYSA
jgi:TnpA family transposase